MGALACGLGFETLSVQLGARNLVASGCRNGETATLALTAPAAVLMVPGVYALETLVFFDRGEILEGLSVW